MEATSAVSNSAWDLVSENQLLCEVVFLFT